MAEMPWFRFFPSDWLGGTRAMSAAETGIYITLIATMYERGEPIPEDHARLARLCGASNSVFKNCIQSLIEEDKIVRVEGGLWNDRVQKEVLYRAEKSEVGSRAAKAKWEQKRNENNGKNDATAMPEQSDRNAIPELRSQIPDIDTSLRSVSAPQAASKTKKGTRLSSDWVLPRTWGQWAMDNINGASVEFIRSQADRFKDYWTSLSGAKGVKSDWEATWRNWCRTASDRLPRGSPPGSTRVSPDEAFGKLMDLYDAEARREEADRSPSDDAVQDLPLLPNHRT